MKNLILALAMITGLIFASSCKKNKDNGLSLKGKWNIVSTQFRHVENGTETDNYTYTGVAGDYVDFRNDNKVYSHVDGDDGVAHYEILENNKVIIDEDTLEIQSLTSASVRLYQKRIEDANTFKEIAVKLKR